MINIAPYLPQECPWRTGFTSFNRGYGFNIQEYKWIMTAYNSRALMVGLVVFRLEVGQNVHDVLRRKLDKAYFDYPLAGKI